MKKYLFGALALPLLFACSSEDFDEKVVSNDQFGGIPTVDAAFSMDEGFTRLDNGSWNPEEGDLWGFAWLTDDHTATPPYTPLIAIDGNAYQNHNLIQKSNYFEPQTAIYVGKYYIYRPYDETTVAPQAINFKSLENQTLAEGYASTTEAWKKLAKKAINIGNKWTEVTPDGHTIGTDPTIWDKAGIKQYYKLYASMFSNQTGLDLTYVKNNPTFAAARTINGATDINYTIAAGESVGAADIYKTTVDLSGQAKSFTYAPTVEPNTGIANGSFWANKKNLAAIPVGTPCDGFSFTAGAVTLTPEDEINGLSTGDNGSTAWFWFNSLPVTAGNATTATAVKAVFTTSYGVVTVNSTVNACAYVFDKYNAAATAPEWIKLAAADNAVTTPKQWNLAGTHNTFVNQYGNHKGKYVLSVDFSTGDMDKMHIKSDTHLQKLLRYYLASGKTAGGITLLLDKDADNEFKLSKISIALLQTINAGSIKVQVKACDEDENGTPSTVHTPGKIVITQDGQAALGLADATEVPELDDVFAVATDVYLASGTNWTWKERSGANRLTIDANVASITNLGTLKVNATNIETNPKVLLTNAAGATMNITKVTTVKTALTNLGTINVGAADNTGAELRAYNVEIKNDATDHTDLTKRGTINNYGVIGSSDGTTGMVNNYGEINVMNNAAITLLKSNELGIPAFNTPFDGTHKMGSVVIPTPTALVSVSNTSENGFIKYTWPADQTTYNTPAGVVKYNTIVVSSDITFRAGENEIQYIEFNGTRTQVVNPTNGTTTDPGYLTNLKGIIVNAGKSIIIEKTNGIVCSTSAFLGAGATIYKGGVFAYPATAPTNNYFGTWSKDQVVKW